MGPSVLLFIAEGHNMYPWRREYLQYIVSILVLMSKYVSEKGCGDWSLDRRGVNGKLQKTENKRHLSHLVFCHSYL